ncbi:MAG: MBL fold metallo-hydrolase [Candidatus Aminicenantes bacterium RBG_13_63_10]|nr:MAG: MBL fold metallo-hydrolase [Candidatus Aminicenantes bacterium RBG_13_63_10]
MTSVSDGRRELKPGGLPSGGTIRFTILYDNYLHKEGTRADWGFSCLVEGTEKTILFDTGTDPRILLHNAEVLGVDLKNIDLIVISHNHGDHTGGLPAVLERNPAVTVFAPKSFPSSFGRGVEDRKAAYRAVDSPVEICPRVHLTGELGAEIIEQSLVIDTPRGLVVVTGCSHPGIVNILRRAGEILDKPIHLVFGGFHLRGKTEAEVADIISAFRELKVEKCGATHCTGDKPIAAFREAFGKDFVPLGTGKIIEVEGF